MLLTPRIHGNQYTEINIILFPKEDHVIVEIEIVFGKTQKIYRSTNELVDGVLEEAKNSAGFVDSKPLRGKVLRRMYVVT